MDTSALEAAYELLLAEVRHLPPERETSPGAWGADAVLAHLVATNRMIAAASAELLAGRIPVVDNRPTQSTQYLRAIVDSAGGREELVSVLARSAREVLILAEQLADERAETAVPTIIVDGGRYRVERPVPFSNLLAPTHVLEHLQQLEELD